jgi:predicted nucleic acid-binding protein
MPEIIVNTSPLQYLHQLGCLDLLAQLYGRVLVPAAVRQELQQGATLGIDLPTLENLSWVALVAADEESLARVSDKLGAGERAVIALGLTKTEPLLILDDAEARGHAKKHGLRITGTLGVLLKSKQTGGIVVMSPLLDALEQAGFFLDRATRLHVLALAGETP